MIKTVLAWRRGSLSVPRFFIVPRNVFSAPFHFRMTVAGTTSLLGQSSAGKVRITWLPVEGQLPKACNEIAIYSLHLVGIHSALLKCVFQTCKCNEIHRYRCFQSLTNVFSSLWISDFGSDKSWLRPLKVKKLLRSDFIIFFLSFVYQSSRIRRGSDGAWALLKIQKKCD